jgi:APA family basic amino acid/polyamine antiporter
LPAEQSTANHDRSPASLTREVGVLGATMMGLGSIIGTGVFVSIGIAAGTAGPAVVVAIAAAALVATCNGLSSAQLAANHPMSGGTYEYGYRWLHSSLGFTAGWMFVCAKSASAATAALGCAGYLLHAFGVDHSQGLVPLALALVVVLTILVLCGLRRSSATNVAMVSITLVSLSVFILAALPTALGAGTSNLTPFFDPVDARTSPVGGWLEACALMFVAYTGYGRIATLAEEVHQPRRTIPLAIIITLVASMALYVSIGLIGVAAVGAEAFSTAGVGRAAPLEVVADRLGTPVVANVVAIGAVTAMLGVLLNLVQGLSRVLLAMARRGDLPGFLGTINPSTRTPYSAVIAIGIVIGCLVLIGNVKATWSFSAFTVLIYYAITNLAAIRLRDDERLYWRLFPWVGLVACLFLAFWVESRIWMIGCGLIGGGLIWHLAARRLVSSQSGDSD